MDPSLAIRVENLGKSYTIASGKPPDTFRDRIATLFSRACPTTRRFDALTDVAFDVPRGEVVGIIGRNGAGKSTLLKILSRITEPTRGRAILRGRVASLLEVGTGFHPELTGRENIFLNGAVLGMTRSEIRARFDEIVAFAEVDDFLDVPVKRYSSGMYVRLAFAVAAHLETEILIVDEVLAVGDLHFQEKCLGRMQAMTARSARTVLFVSHQMAAVARICSRCLMLENGRLVADGPPPGVIRTYSASATSASGIFPLADLPRNGDYRNRARFVEARCIPLISFGTCTTIDITMDVTEPLDDLDLGLMVLNSLGTEVISQQSGWGGGTRLVPCGIVAFRLRLPNVRLAPGRYRAHISASSRFGTEDFLAEAIAWEIGEAFDASWHGASAMSGAILEPLEVELLA